MAASSSEIKAEDSPDFSLAIGGPLFQTFIKAHLAGDSLEWLQRRLVLIPLIAWLPLLILSLLQGSGPDVRIPFLRDIVTHVRFLVSLPVLIAAELIVHRRTLPLKRQFLDQKLVSAEEMPAFHAALSAAVRARNSVALEVALIVFIYTVGLWVWWHQVAFAETSWYAQPIGTTIRLKLAGYWYAFVSIPIFQLFLLRWYLRLFIWFWFLFRVARLKLHLVSTHPDRAGGLAFLGTTSYAFAPILFAQSALVAGQLANRIFYEGRSLLEFKMLIIGIVSLLVLFVLGPLTVFTPQLMMAKHAGKAEYGLLARRYVLAFEHKWVKGTWHEDEILGSGDIQSLADLANSYDVVREMRPVPFGLQDLARLAIATAAPILPLTLTVVPLEELVNRLLKMVFSAA